MFFIILGLASYFLFFMGLPGVGAIITRRKWTLFRNRICSYSNLPLLKYDNIKSGNKYVFKGKLESFKSDDVVWLTGDSLSLCIDLNRQDIYTLNRDIFSQTNWSSVISMVEGTSFFVIGKVVYKNGTPYLTGDSDDPLLVVIHDKEYNVFRALIEKARDRNEMWNSYSPYSYITGVLILIILSYLAYISSYNKFTSYCLLVAAGTPFYFILPPGLFFYLKFRKLWDMSIRLSVLRDLYALQDNSKSLCFKRLAKVKERRSLLFYILGYILNVIIAGTILYKMYRLLIYS